MEPWERYAPIVDDPETFRTCCERPLPTAVRVNPIKATPDDAMAALEEDEVATTRAGWNPHTLRLETDHPGRTWAYQFGWVHGQEEISQLPAHVLDPAPGDTVWDAAAAPGGKATQLAAALDEDGIVVANDVNLGRLSALRSNSDRLGVTNMVVTREDARTYSVDGLGIERFDAVLVDAPCSGEGTLRKNPDALAEWSTSAVQGLASVQTGILRRAVELTAPGGTIVYSTCTFAPEENEGVLTRICESEDVAIVPFETDLEAAPGVTSWQDESYHPDVRHVQRFYPHLNDTGGFVCAKLEVGG